MHKTTASRRNRAQGGYALLAVVVVMSVFTVVSLQYMERTAKSIQLSGYGRDSSESLLMAEGAMNMLYGRFIFDDDIDGDDINDNTETIDSTKSPPGIPLPYMFYVTGGHGIDQTAPSLLQRIANGEASATSGAVENHSISASKLRVDDLFQGGPGTAPLLFVQDTDNAGHLKISHGSWNSTNDTHKAAAWLELVQSPTQAGKIQVFVQALAQVGNSKSYVQRFAGTFSATLGRRFGALNESNPATNNNPGS